MHGKQSLVDWVRVHSISCTSDSSSAVAGSNDRMSIARPALFQLATTISGFDAEGEYPCESTGISGEKKTGIVFMGARSSS